MPTRKLEKENYIVSKVAKLKKFSTLSMAIQSETLQVTGAEAQVRAKKHWESTSATLQWRRQEVQDEKRSAAANKRTDSKETRRCIVKAESPRNTKWWDAQPSGGSREKEKASKWEKQKRNGIVFPRKTFSCQHQEGTVKGLQTESICWKQCLILKISHIMNMSAEK